MKLPESDNPEVIDAYKDGYRQAIAGTSKELYPVAYDSSQELKNSWLAGWYDAKKEYNMLNEYSFSGNFLWIVLIVCVSVAVYFFLI